MFFTSFPYLITSSPSVLNLVITTDGVCKELSFLVGGEVSLVRVVELVGGAGDVVLESSKVQGNALYHDIIIITIIIIQRRKTQGLLREINNLLKNCLLTSSLTSQSSHLVVLTMILLRSTEPDAAEHSWVSALQSGLPAGQ